MHLNVAHNTAAFYSLLTIIVLDWMSIRLVMEFLVLTFYFFNNECMQEKRFHNWLEGARDWAVSRTRFWGTPLPLWMSQDGEEIVVMDSIEKLEKLSGVKVSISTIDLTLS